MRGRSGVQKRFEPSAVNGRWLSLAEHVMNVTTLKPNQPGLCSLQGIKDSTVPKPGEGLAAR
jgi:hypothetical protein